ncbi:MULTISPECIES: hypothetical protein [unclassified Rathayibacter]|uniref:hypothetical protein n=1 Tax=unclassified Rathayibacter TaxID=2609250 RepID=UPI00188C3B53|nr:MULTISPECIES: hypothetical protein [unclassified Rathayibacter]MBF4462606.1 hypothetical protein [Rathayibacter sp. VKM Ac-2879]MBF4503351.1 hypothetical protein [Rathayibacter sp. VKM Ac-2878]
MDPTIAVRLFDSDGAVALTEFLHGAYAELGAMGLNYTAVDQDAETTRKRALGGQSWIVEQKGQRVGAQTIGVRRP